MNICIIPARAGSTRIKNKNIRDFHGMPIIAYSIKTARMCGLFDAVFVSTDSDEIARISKSYGAGIIERPSEFGVDSVGTWTVTKHALDWLTHPDRYAEDIEYICTIYATAPLMLSGDLIRGYDLIENKHTMHAISIGYPNLHDAAQFYWSRPEAFYSGVDYFDHRTALVKIPKNRVCDINIEDDWIRAESLYEDLMGKKDG